MDWTDQPIGVPGESACDVFVWNTRPHFLNEYLQTHTIPPYGEQKCRGQQESSNVWLRALFMIQATHMKQIDRLF